MNSCGELPLEPPAMCYRCPVCGREIWHRVYLRGAEICGCDSCMQALPAEEVLPPVAVKEVRG